MSYHNFTLRYCRIDLYMAKKTGVQIHIQNTEETFIILKEIARLDNNKDLPQWLNSKLNKLSKGIDVTKGCAPCAMELSRRKSYVYEFPDFLTEKINCLSTRFNTQPASFVKRFIIDPAIAKYFEEKGEF